MKTSKPLLTGQQGLGLLELMLAMVIAITLIIAGIKQYESYQENSRIMITRQAVSILLEKAGNFYQANCLTDPFYPNKNPTDFSTLTKNTLKATPSDPQALDLSVITRNIIQPAYFGAFDDGQPFKAFLTVSENINSNSDNKNRFGATWLWHTNVEACIQTLGEDQNTLKSIFDADSVKTGDASCDGVLLAWERLPRNDMGVMDAAQAEYNRQYRFGQWMLRPGSQVDQGVFNYLCQY